LTSHVLAILAAQGLVVDSEACSDTL
jgi:hypothetical protein